MQAHEPTSGTSHYETYSLICIAAPITRLFCGERSEHSALVWGKLILHFTCHFGQLNWCLLHKQLFLSTVESNQKSSRRKNKWGTSSEKSRKAIYQMLPDCSSSLSCALHTPSWQKKCCWKKVHTIKHTLASQSNGWHIRFLILFANDGQCFSSKHCASANCLFYTVSNTLGPTGDRPEADNARLYPAPWSVCFCFHPH